MEYIKSVDHICHSCRESSICELWDQVCNIDESFIKEAFSYDPTVQSVCLTVSYCKLYKPIEPLRK